MLRKTVFCLAVSAAMLVAGSACAGTTFLSNYGGLFTFQNDGTFTGDAVGIGLVYAPTATLLSAASPGRVQFVPSDFNIWVTQVFRDGDADLSMTGCGYTFFKWAPAAMKFTVEAAPVFKVLDANKFKVGGYGGLRIAMDVGQPLQFRVGSGYDGDNPVLMVSLGVMTGE